MQSLDIMNFFAQLLIKTNAVVVGSNVWKLQNTLVSTNKNILLIQGLIALCPLLGLLGTVTGMIVTFQMITLYGTGDPKLMAGGISQALVTTVLGLLVAIPTSLLHSFTQSSARGIISILEEQSTGILAEKAEK